MGHESADEITKLLQGWRGSDRKALDTLVPLAYQEPHRLAHFQLRQERPGHTLQSAALVNEAYVRMVGFVPQSGRAAHISLPSQRSRYGRSSSIPRARVVPENVAVVRRRSRSKTRRCWCQKKIKTGTG